MLQNIHDDFLKVLSLSFVIQGNLKMSEPFGYVTLENLALGPERRCFTFTMHFVMKR